MLCTAAIAFVYGDTSCVQITAWVQATMRFEQQRMFLSAIEKDVTQHIGPLQKAENGIAARSVCNDWCKGRKKVFTH